MRPILFILCLGLALSSATQATATEHQDNMAEFAYLFVDNPNGKFGEYNGLDENNHNIALGIDWFLRNGDEPARYWDIDVHNLGLETFFARVESEQDSADEFQQGAFAFFIRPVNDI